MLHNIYKNLHKFGQVSDTRYTSKAGFNLTQGKQQPTRHRRKKYVHLNSPLNGAVYPTWWNDIERPRGRFGERKLPLRWIGDEVVQIVRVTTGIGYVLELRHKTTVEREQVLIRLVIWKCDLVADDIWKEIIPVRNVMRVSPAERHRSSAMGQQSRYPSASGRG